MTLEITRWEDLDLGEERDSGPREIKYKGCLLGHFERYPRSRRDKQIRAIGNDPDIQSLLETLWSVFYNRDTLEHEGRLALEELERTKKKRRIRNDARIALGLPSIDVLADDEDIIELRKKAADIDRRLDAMQKV